MKESYLHYLWKTKRFDSRKLKLTCGSAIDIVNVGWHNPDAGPDFFNGTVVINGIKWTGNIELHVRSSDWYLHEHHLDEAYNNVILHVVYEYNTPVLIREKELPTLVLKEHIDKDHYANFNQLFNDRKEKPCVPFLEKNKGRILEQIQLSFFHRLERKGLALVNSASTQNLKPVDTMLRSIAKAFGGRLNKKPMEELITGLTMKIIWKEGWNDDRVNALFFGKAGFLKNPHTGYSQSLEKNWEMLKRKYALNEMNVSSWKFKGVRPSSFPTRRVAELAQVAKRLTPEAASLRNTENIKDYFDRLFDFHLNEFWIDHHRFQTRSKRRNNLNLSDTMKQSILINGVAPYLIYRKHAFGEFENDELILELLTEIPAEKNNVIKQWKTFGVQIENSVDSQGLLELNNEFCIFRKCLNCQLGKAILDR